MAQQSQKTLQQHATQEGESLRESNRSAVEKLAAGYKGGKEMPLAAYAGLMGVFGLGFAGLLIAARKRRSSSEQKTNLTDIALGGVATYKLSRLIAKDRVTAPLRAPFTEYVEPAGTSEVKEKVRGTGAQRAMGDLLTCPYCMSPWVATALAYGFVTSPRLARLVSGIFATVAISDLLQHADEAIRKREEGES